MQGRIGRLRKPAGLAILASAALLLPASAWGNSPIVVTNTGDGGPGSLRQAVADANASPGSTIVFHVPTSDPGFNGHWFTIKPSTPLPLVAADGTTIDGGTQTAFTGDTNPAGPEVFLDGRLMTSNAPATPGGIWIESSSTTVEGLTVSGFVGEEIVIDGGDSDVLRGDDVGTDPSGTSAILPPVDARAFENDGVWVIDGATSTVLGGTTAAARNVISGNQGLGILVSSPDAGVKIEGNYLGTNGTGTAALGTSGAAVWVGPYAEWANEAGPTGVTIGGTTAGAGNLISGNGVDDAGAGIAMGGVSGVTIQGNLIGTDASGSAAIPNDANGIVCYGDVTNSLIGGTSAGARNVISGNTVGINLADGCSNDRIEGNYIGTNAAGDAGLGNTEHGIGIDGAASNTVIGGTGPGAGNVISGNGMGVIIGGGSPVDPSGTIIQGNRIGTDATGTQAIGNVHPGVGIYGAVNTLIGGTSSAAANVISGNGVGIDLGLAAGTIVQGNEIGTGASGVPVPNRNDGVEVSTTGDQPSPKQIVGNTIAYNGGNGVGVYGDGANTISRNSIFSNAGLGIDLGGDGVTPNDAGDTDNGPNGLQNFPVITSTRRSASQLVVRGTIDTQNPQTVTLEFFANPVPAPGGDPSGYGEGAVFLGTATPQADGSFSATLPSVAPGALISATATDAAGNTSEFAEEAVALPASADECKNGGWQSYGVFKNQGDCVSFVATDGKNPPNG